MKINLIAVGKKMPSWVNAGYEEYAKRLSHHCTLQLIEIPLVTRSKNTNVSQLLEQESQKILHVIPNKSYSIALDVDGQAWDTAKLAKQLQQWQMQQHEINFLIGGPDGLAASCKQQAQQSWSLSDLTFPHPLVRIILVEQLYRAFSILSHHPYHRE